MHVVFEPIVLWNWALMHCTASTSPAPIDQQFWNAKKYEDWNILWNILNSSFINVLWNVHDAQVVQLSSFFVALGQFGQEMEVPLDDADATVHRLYAPGPQCITVCKVWELKDAERSEDVRGQKDSVKTVKGLRFFARIEPCEVFKMLQQAKSCTATRLVRAMKTANTKCLHVFSFGTQWNAACNVLPIRPGGEAVLALKEALPMVDIKISGSRKDCDCSFQMYLTTYFLDLVEFYWYLLTWTMPLCVFRHHWLLQLSW